MANAEHFAVSIQRLIEALAPTFIAHHTVYDDQSRRAVRVPPLGGGAKAPEGLADALGAPALAPIVRQLVRLAGRFCRAISHKCSLHSIIGCGRPPRFRAHVLARLAICDVS